MANHASSKKRVKRNAARNEVNTARKSRMRSSIKKVEQAIEAGKSKDAQEALQKAQPEISRAVSKGILHKNTAARKVSRLSKRIKGLK